MERAKSRRGKRLNILTNRQGEKHENGAGLDERASCRDGASEFQNCFMLEQNNGSK